MENIKNQVFVSILLIALISLVTLAYNTDDVIMNKLFSGFSVISGLLVLKLLSNKSIKEKDEQF
jgi:hypothetical protein